MPARSGFLGVRLEDARPGARIAEVLKDTAAERIGLRADDVLVTVSGVRIKTFQNASRTIGSHRVGSTIDLEVRRNGRPLTLQAVLGPREPNDRLNGRVSEVRSGFSEVFQHDGVLSPSECGGPTLNLDGRALGLNIARSDRTATYALPATTVLAALKRMQAGNGSPDAY